MYLVMMEGDRAIHVSRYCIVEEEPFSLLKKTNAIRVNEEELDDGAGRSSEDGEVFVEEEHNLLPPVSQPVTVAQQNRTNSTFK